MGLVLNKINDLGLMPVVAIDDAEDAVPLARALSDGGLPAVEITFRTEAAELSIKKIAEELPDVTVGAGTVISTEQAERAISAGARFIVSPGLNPRVIEYALSKGVPIVPGTATPSEMEQAMSMGLDTVKFFPAEQNGGLGTLKAIAAAYGNLRFFPTGGINAENIAQYIAFDKVIACGGSWMAPKELIREKRFNEITELAKAAVASMLGFRFVHVGVNAPDGPSALNFAGWLSDTFGFDYKEGNSSVFAAGDCFEIMKRMGRGSMGHIGVETNSLPRAIAHLKARGCELDEENAFYRNGRMIAIYLKEERAGFAFHLVQK